mgnify:FL=1
MSITADEINRGLHRQVRTGALYGAFMPPSDCSSTKLGNGDTSFAIQNMAKTARKYQHHTRDLTLKFFSGMPLEKLCNDIHQFLYWHFQYSIDGANQLLRSPACSWLSRFDGIDCKSYSIFASTILLNAGIKHYMRRIKQEMNPDGFTHVYVVVPKNQKTANLAQGYYVIDGTINTTKELPYIEKDDVLVNENKVSLSSPLPVIVGNDTLTQKRQAWKTFVEAIDNIGAMNPNNPELAHLKARVYLLAKENRTDVPFKIDGFTITLDGRKYNLWKKEYETPALGEPDVNQQLEDLLNQSYEVGKQNAEATSAHHKQKSIQKVNAVGNAASATATATIVAIGGKAALASNAVPGVGTIVGLCIAAVTAIVALAIMLWGDPCAGAFYTSEFINSGLKEQFFEQFKTTMNTLRTKLEQGLEPTATSELNKLLKEIDLGSAHYYHECQVHNQKCSTETLKSYDTFVKNTKKAVDDMLDMLKFKLSENFNVAIIERQGSVSERSWYFIVPSGKDVIQAKYRFLKVESRNDKKGMYPYGSEQSFDTWLEDNVTTLRVEYGAQQAENYRREMLPFKEKIASIRRNIYLPVVTQVTMEDELRREQYSIYLKYDKKYQKELLDLAHNKADAYNLANKLFWEELKKVRAQRLYEEQHSVDNIKKIASHEANQRAGLENKKLLNLALVGALGIGVLTIISKN